MRDHMICIGHKLNINMLLLGYREVEQRRKPYELWAIIVMACLCAIGKPPKKTGKKVHNSCELSPKMENPPPPPISQQI